MVSLRAWVVLLVASTLGCSLVNPPGAHTGGADAGADAAAVDTTDAAISESDALETSPPRMRVAHLARDTGRIDVFANGVRVTDRLAFSDVSGSVEVPSGSVDLVVTRAGETAPLLEQTMTSEPGRDYTLTVYGDEDAPPIVGRTLELLLLENDASGFDVSREIKLAVVHVAVPVVAGQLVSIGPAGNTLLIDEFGFRAVAPLTLASRGYTVGFDAGADGFVDVEFVIPSLPAGTYANVFVASRPDDSVYLLVNTAEGTTLEIDAARTRLRVAHLARDTAAVDVYANGNLITPDLAFSGVGTPVDVPSEAVRFRVVRAGTDEVLVEDTFTTVLGREYTLTLYGDEVTAPTFDDRTLGLLLLDDDASGFDRTREIRLAAVHVAVPVVAGQLVAIRPAPDGNLLLVDDFGFGAVAPLTLASMPYTVGFDAGADGVVDVEFDVPVLVPGTYANVFVAARPDDSVYLLVNTSRGGTLEIDAN